MSYGAVHLAIHPCSKLQGILAKANEKGALRPLFSENVTARFSGPLQDKKKINFLVPGI
jgi:hypothetical protein